MTGSASLGITERLANFSVSLRYEELTPPVITDAKNGILDFLGVALVGAKDESTRTILKASKKLNGAGKSTLLGMSTQTSPSVAALVNCYAAQALDYDDVQHRCGTHMSAPVLAAALALAEKYHHSGKALLTAYLAGMEIGCRLGRAARFCSYLRMHGIHPTGFLGHFGAAAGAGKLLGLDALQMRRSYGIAAGKAAGLMRSFGSMCKPTNGANAAQDALLSALLAKQGFTAPEEILEGEHNIFTITGGQTDPEELVRGLGQEFEISHNTFKAFACTGWRNPIAEALIALSTTHQLQSQDVKKIHIQVFAEMMRLPNYPEPRTGLEGKFSVAHVAAVALVDRAAGIAQFSDERVADPALAELRRKVTVEVGPELEIYQVRITVHTTDGRELSHFVPIQKGDYRNPLNRDELIAKFRANALAVLPQEQVEAVAAMIWDIETVRDVAELMQLCRSRKQPTRRTGQLLRE